jgi:hypothetical protein
MDNVRDDADAQVEAAGGDNKLSVIERFLRLFRGSDRTHGVYCAQAKVDPGKKNEGSAKTIPGPVTVALWQQHLDGGDGLGIVPVNAAGECWWGAIDIDEYLLDLPALARRARAFNLPLIVCRTKSGGAHLYLFMQGPTLTTLIREKLREWAGMLGYPGSEIFPKQDRLDSGEYGNWINMPYQAGDNTKRYALDPDTGKAMTPAEFLDRAEAMRITPDALRNWQVVLPADANLDELLSGAPPCLNVLIRIGIHDGARNNGLYNVAIFLKKKFPDDWQQRIYQCNAKVMHPPLADKEVKAAIKSVDKKDYRYKCKEAPIHAQCDSATCVTREFGIKGGDGENANPKKLPPLLGAVRLMRESEEWRGVLAFDDFAKRAVLLRPIPGAVDRGDDFLHDLRDIDVTDATLWLQGKGLRIGTSTVREAVHVVAADFTFHPVRNYLRQLQWDGFDRIDTWLTNHLGAADTPFNRAAGAKWLIGGVARVMQPGCQLKTVPIFEGPQDIGKSTVLAILAVHDRWFTDHLSNLATKDAREEVQGKWIIEFAEFDVMRRAEVSQAKAFLSARQDHFRPSYGRIAEDFPRQWIGAATINPGGTGYLRDETGAVRFWPVACADGWEPGRCVDFNALRAERDQLWAEAIARYYKGEEWWIDDQALREAHAELTEARGEDDPREPRVRTILAGCKWIQMADILLGLEYSADRHSKTLQTEIGGLMTRLKWVRWRGRTWGPAGPGYYYFPPGTRDLKAYAAKMTKEAKAAAAGYQKQMDEAELF